MGALEISLQATSSPSTVTGKLVDILIPNSATTPPTFLLNLELPGNSVSTKHDLMQVTVTLAQLKRLNSSFSFLGEESIQALIAGKGLGNEARGLLQEKLNLLLSVEFEAGQGPRGLLGAQTPSYTARKIEVKSMADLRPAGSNTRATGTSVPAGWPTTDVAKLPAFTPVPVNLSLEELLTGVWRLGYARIPVPPSMISHQRQTRVDQQPTLRQSGSNKSGQGFAYDSYTLTYVVTGPEEIQAGIKDVYDQLALTPFLTAEGGPFGTREVPGAIPFQEVAVRSMTISTVDGVPNALQVNIEFDPFLWHYYLPYTTGKYARMSFDHAICWPLFKLWASTRSRSKFHGRKMDGLLSFSFPDPSLNSFLREMSSSPEQYSPVAEDVGALDTLAEGILNGDAQRLRSANVKELRFSNSGTRMNDRVVVLKINDARMWSELVDEPVRTYPTGDPGETYTEGPGGLAEDSLMGLIDWNNKLAYHNYTAADGKYSPTSVTIPADFLDRDYGSHSVGALTLDDFNTQLLKARKSLGASLMDQLAADANAQLAAATTDSQRAGIKEQFRKHALQPWSYFGIVLHITDENKSKVVQRMQKLRARASERLNVSYTSQKDRLVSQYDADESMGMYTLNTGAVTEDILIERVSATKAHNAAVTSYLGNPLPLHEHIGSQDTVCVIEGRCFSEAAKHRLMNLKEEFERRALNKTSRRFLTDQNEVKKQTDIGAGFMRVENEILQLMGVEFAMPLNIEVHTVEGQPGVWEFSLQLVDYDPKLMAAERMRYLETTSAQLGQIYQYGWNWKNNINPILQKARDYFSLQYSLSKVEVYQDMALPSFSELEYWIDSCRRFALAYKSLTADQQARLLKDGLMPSTGTNKASRLNVMDRKVLKTVAEFLPRWSEEMSQWTQFRNSANRLSDSGVYADPDFYVYYDPRDSWGHLVDTLTEELMGQQDALKARGHEGQAKDQPAHKSAVRFTDPVHGDVRSAMDGDFFTATAEKIGQHNTLLYDQMYPVERAQAVKAEKDAAEERFDAKSIGQWWNPNGKLLSVADPNDPNTIILSQAQQLDFYRGVVSDQNTNFEEQLSGGNPAAKLPANLTTGEVQADQYPAASDWLSLGWRQNLLRQIMAGGRSGTYGASRSQANRHDGWADYPVYWVPTSRSFYGELAPLQPKQTTAELKAEIEDDLRKYNTKSDGGVFSFLHKAMAANSLDAREIKAGQPAISIQSGSQDLNKNFDGLDPYVRWSSNKHGPGNVVDPRVIEAVLLRRGGMGAFDQKGSQNQGGLGDLSLEYLRENAMLDMPREGVIDTLVKQYAQYMKEFSNVPTLALLALNMNIDAKQRAKYWTKDDQGIKASILDDLRQAGRDVSARRFGPEAATTIRDTLLKYQGSEQLDEYFTAYIHLNRTMGPIMRNQLDMMDPYFLSYHALITADLGDNEGRYLQTTFSPTGAPITIPLQRKVLQSNLADVDRYNPGFNANNTSLDQQIQLAKRLKSAMDPHSEAAIYGALVDLRTHSSFGRLAAAFPTYQVLIINEGFYWGGGNSRLWDQYYTRAGVSDIEVFKTRTQPASECHITFSNMFMNLTAYYHMEVLQQQLAVQNNKRVGDFATNPLTLPNMKLFWEMFLRRVPDEVVRIWQQNHLRQLALGVGARLHVRLGWGSNAALLPEVFNGTVVQAPVSDGYMTLMAVGDGVELDKMVTTSLVPAGDSYAFSDGAILGTGKDPSSIITEAIISAGLWDVITEQNWRDKSQGVSHFGDPYFDGGRYYTPDLQINLYSSNPTRLEQGIPQIRDYFNVAALYNWENVNLFSVEIKEPTLWKIMEACRRACVDYVASAETFALRSTIFFGKWWWPYNYTYDPSILEVVAQHELVGRSIHTEDSLTLSKVDIAQGGGSQQKKSVTQGKSVGMEKLNPDQFPAEVMVTLKQLVAERYPLAPTAWKIKTWTVKSANREYDVFKIYYQMTTGHSEIDQQSWVATIEYNKIGNKTRSAGVQAAGPLDQQGADVVEGVVKRGETEQQYASRFTAEGERIGANAIDLVGDIYAFRQYLRWKTYMQAYFAHSMINLLQNEIETNKDLVYTDAYGIHKYNGILSGDSINRTIVYSVDTDITPEDRRTMEVDTGLALTAIQNVGKALSEGVLTTLSYVPLVGTLAGPALDYVQQTPTTPAVNNAVVSALVDSVKEMYAGTMVLAGQPTMKPRDLVFVEDHKLGMRGPVFVKDVIHKLDGTNGLKTYVSPDCVVYPHGSMFGHHLVTSLCLGALKRVSSMYVMKSMSALTFGAVVDWRRAKGGVEIANDLGRYRRALANASITDVEKALVRDKAFYRHQSGLVEQLNKLDPADPYYEELSKQIRTKMNRLDAINTLAEMEREFGTANVDYSGLTDSSSERIKLVREEERILAEQLEDERAARAVGITDPEKVAERAANNRRAAWARNNQNQVLQLVSDPGTEIHEQMLELRVRRDRTIRRIENLTKASAEIVVDEAEDNALRVARLLEIETEVAELGDTLTDVNRELAALTRSMQITEREADLVLRFAARPSLVRKDGRLVVTTVREVLDDLGETSTFAERFLGRIFGGTTDAVAGTANLLDKLLEPAERAALDELGDSARIAGAPRGTTKARQYLTAVRTFWTDVKTEGVVAKLGRPTARMGTAAFKTANNIVRGAHLLSYAGPQAIVRMAVDAVILIVGGSIVEGINARWKARQCVKILPLVVHNHPWVAGIRGHQGAVVGDDPSWADNLLFGWSKMNTDIQGHSQDFKGYSSFLGSNMLMFSAAMLGVEAPEYALDSGENPFIERELAGLATGSGHTGGK